jgi:hypothetical protein
MYIDRPFTMNLPLSSAGPVAVTVGFAVAVVAIAVGAAVDGIAAAVGGIDVAVGTEVTAGVQALRAMTNNNTAMISFRLFNFSPPLTFFLLAGWTNACIVALDPQKYLTFPAK